MPRIYAVNEDYSNAWASVPATNGVLALPAGTDTSWFEDNGFTVDDSKNELTLLDGLTSAQLRSICEYLGITIDADADNPDSKHELVRAIEGEISSKYISSVSVSSAAGTTAGTSAITITGEGTYKYKTAKDTAPSLLYMDVPDSTWEDIKTGDEIEPGAADHNKIAVVKLNAAGYVIGIGSATLTVAAD